MAKSHRRGEPQHLGVTEEFSLNWWLLVVRISRRWEACFTPGLPPADFSLGSEVFCVHPLAKSFIVFGLLVVETPAAHAPGLFLVPKAKIKSKGDQILPSIL